MIFSAFLIRLLQLSAAGEVFLEGTCPLSRCPQTAKLPAPCFWRTEKGEKSDSFSRAERTRPLRPVCRLLLCDFGNVPVERFHRISLCRNRRTRHAVSLQRVLRNCKLFSVLLGTTFATSHRDIAKIKPFLSGFTRGAVLFAPAKSCRFLSLSPCAQKYGHGDFAVCGRRLRGHVPSKKDSCQLCSVGSA